MYVLSALNNWARSQLAWKQLKLPSPSEVITWFHGYYEVPNGNVQPKS